MDSSKKHQDNILPRRSPETELSSSFIDAEIFSGTQLAEYEAISTRFEEQESPFLNVFEKAVPDDLEEPEQQLNDKDIDEESMLDEEFLNENVDSDKEKYEEADWGTEENEYAETMTFEPVGMDAEEQSDEEFDDELKDELKDGFEDEFEDDFEDELVEKNEFEEESWYERETLADLQDNDPVENTEIPPKYPILLDQQVGIFPAVCNLVVKRTVPPAIGFEFDLNIGATDEMLPPESPDYSLEGKKITKHKKTVDGFRCKGDGNRIEIGTAPFELTQTGQQEMKRVMKNIMDLIAEIKNECKRTNADYSLGYNKKIGAPVYFEPPKKHARVNWIFPLSFYPKRNSYYSQSCNVGASPQATLTLPLAKIDQFVTVIRKSERYGWSPGKALSGPNRARQGTRSQALYQARRMVNQSRNWHIKHQTKLSNGDIVSSENFSPTLQGLMILMVSYLRTSELKYNPRRDYEIFAKAYLPLNVKNPFRLLFADLTSAEKQTFKDLYNDPKAGVNRMIWRLAKRNPKKSDEDKQLFPSKVEGHQKNWFHHAPTWGEFIEKTVSNTPLLREVGNYVDKEKGEHLGCEVLWAPLSKNVPYEPNSRRVTVEMRRLGFDWVSSNRWLSMTMRLFQIAEKLNR